MPRMKITDINLRFQDMPGKYDSDVQEIMAKIRNGEKVPPILVSRQGYLQDGRHRLAAYMFLGRKEIDVVFGNHPAAEVKEKKEMAEKKTNCKLCRHCTIEKQKPNNMETWWCGPSKMYVHHLKPDHCGIFKGR